MIILIETIDLIKSMNNNIFRKLYNVYQSPNILSREIGSLKHNHSFKNSPLGIPHPLPYLINAVVYSPFFRESCKH